MITVEEARILVDRYVASIPTCPGDGPCIVWGEKTEEYAGCWVYYWNNKKYIETGDKGYRVGGNYPIIVDKINGTLYHTGFFPIEQYVESFHGDKEKLKRLKSRYQNK